MTKEVTVRVQQRSLRGFWARLFVSEPKDTLKIKCGFIEIPRIGEKVVFLLYGRDQKWSGAVEAHVDDVSRIALQGKNEDCFSLQTVFVSLKRRDFARLAEAQVNINAHLRAA